MPRRKRTREPRERGTSQRRRGFKLSEKRIITLEDANRMVACFYQEGINDTRELINGLRHILGKRKIGLNDIDSIILKITRHVPDSESRRINTWQRLGNMQKKPEYRIMNPLTETTHAHSFTRKLRSACNKLQAAQLEETRDFLRRNIVHAIEELEQYMHQQIAYKKLFSGEVAKRTVDLNAVLRETIDIVFPTMMPKIEIIRETKEPVNTDPYLVAFLLDNILSNASKALLEPNNGKIIITLRASGHKTELSVQDSGIGMSKAKVRKVMKGAAFGWNEELGIPSGGIGMPLIKRALQLLGDVKTHTISEEGKGTTVTLTFS